MPLHVCMVLDYATPSFALGISCVARYASYGSNLCMERLLCYVQGGRLPGMLESLPDYPGCRDPTPPSGMYARLFVLPLAFTP